MFRILCAIITAWLVSFGLFAFMAIMIPKEKKSEPVAEPFALSFEVVSLVQEAIVINHSKTLPPKPQFVSRLPSFIPAPDPVDSIKLTLPTHALPEINSDVEIEKVSLTKEYSTPAHPIVRTLPRYPLNAAISNLEGWVKIVFEINSKGEVVNPQVLDSTPPGVFEQAALDAIKGWRYKPKFEQGEYLHQKDLLVKINFDL